MHGAHTRASESWHKRRLAVDQSTGEWVGEYSATEDGEVTRWLRSRRGFTADSLVHRGDGEIIYFNLPATLTANVEVTEGDWRMSMHEVTITLVQNGTGPFRAEVNSVQMRRLGTSGITATALRGFSLPDLVNWMVTYPPVCEVHDGDRQDKNIQDREPAANSVLSPIRTRSGKKGVTVVDPVKVAEVVRLAPPRQLHKTLKEAFPDVGMRTLMRAKAQAIEDGLLDE